MSGWLTDVSNLAIAASALLAALNLWWYRKEASRKLQEDAIQNWQIALLHKLFQPYAESSVTFDVIMSKYREEASALHSYNVPKEKLSEFEMRNLLARAREIYMIENVGNDSYKLRTEKFDSGSEQFSELMGSVLGPFLGAFTNPIMERQLVEEAVLGIVSADQFKMRQAELTLAVSKATGMSGEAVGPKIVKLLTVGHLKTNSRGFIGLGSTEIADAARIEGLET